MLLNFIKNITLLLALFLTNNIVICQNSDVNNKSEHIELEKEDLNETSQDHLIQNETLSDESIFNKKRSIINKNHQENQSKSTSSEDFKTKIGSLFSRIGISIRKYCHDNKISGKKLLKIGKLFI
jgi:hypothetical protein